MSIRPEEVPPPPELCRNCDGTGVVPTVRFGRRTDETCDECMGTTCSPAYWFDYIMWLRAQQYLLTKAKEATDGS